MPIQGNHDSSIGPDDDGTRPTFNIQPVIPVSLNADWNLITRVIVPIVSQDDIPPGARDQFGLGDTTVSLFFSPVKPAFGKLIRGVGPVFLLPTASNDLLGGEKSGLPDRRGADAVGAMVGGRAGQSYLVGRGR